MDFSVLAPPIFKSLSHRRVYGGVLILFKTILKPFICPNLMFLYLVFVRYCVCFLKKDKNLFSLLFICILKFLIKLLFCCFEVCILSSALTAAPQGQLSSCSKTLTNNNIAVEIGCGCAIQIDFQDAG